ncbi:TnsD family Tn7-like transposition protein [Clostridium cibarium]|uniref:TniQ family protein n=1 Tax=Clostridium cibarium TaxID=2762247 RepID=A0ABR8PUV3_9CLOT|nr:TnsD family Tn7-like transposition protein [Clostridium cibarium]MBD7911968.1 TniQ family protein [Clostridium cibarium]
MLYFFTDPYEDEVFFNIIARYNIYSGNLSERKTNDDLFGTRTKNNNNNLPCFLQYFCNQFNNQSIYTPEHIIMNHTIFPLYLPFVVEERITQLINDMKGSNSREIQIRIGEMAGGICKGFGIRVCLKCIDEDNKKYGESYIHREHQIPGNQICYKHSEVLRKIVLPKYLGRCKIVDFNTCSVEPSNNIVNESNIIYFKNLCSDINSILTIKNKDIRFQELIKKYKVMLAKKGFASIGGIINWSKVDSEFFEFYPSNFLSVLESSIKEDDKTNWTRMLMNRKIMVHPIRHLLFIRYLFGSVSNLIMFNELEYRPFGTGPWPCLNPVASHYKEDVITEMELSKRSTTIKPLGIFKCECGYSYTRLGPDKDISDRYNKRTVKSFGQVWIKGLKDNIEKRIYNISDLMRIMECDSKTIGRYAKDLGVFHLLNSRMKTYTVKKEKARRYDEKLEPFYKADIVRYIKENPNAIRANVEKKLSKQCAWMHRYRKEWLDSVMPKQVNRHIDCRKVNQYVDWSDRDNDISEKVLSIIDEIRKKDMNIKITVSLISRELKLPIMKYVYKLPKTELVLKDHGLI